jgi:hypothetical protein
VHDDAVGDSRQVHWQHGSYVTVVLTAAATNTATAVTAAAAAAAAGQQGRTMYIGEADAALQFFERMGYRMPKHFK